ncbi:uncharacterized protein [Arachis hypogaea]|uniref:uncharacterized protein isoform X1 n=1 Tax=Arachis hypogaea TaxID=3818 RepID=UPI000DEC2D51|nr:probable serine/threonine-protein kinase nek3 isoform X2 [Arachis hypogaea]QHO46239.1 uncharacterized protein DS421_6g185660 [Arachis hypogaea]
MISEPESSLRKRDVSDRRLSIIDVSSADDSLLDSNPLNHHPLENQQHTDFLYTPNSKKFEDAATKLKEWEREPCSNETSDVEKPKKNSKCNLRKSLAWDSAFFTSAGVLDPEELSSIIEGVEKEEKHALPGIQEDVYKSCDSLSTLGSESLTLEMESQEGDLFEDVRASIQKSSDKKLSLASGKSKVTSAVSGLQTDEASKRIHIASRNKIKAPPTSKNPSAAQGLGKITKRNPTFPQLPQPVATRRESSISKQSKVPGKPSPISTLSSKRVSLGENLKAKRIIGGNVHLVPKASVVRDSHGILPKPSVSYKSPSVPSLSSKTKSATSTSAGTLKPPSSRSAVSTPSKIASTNKTEYGPSNLSSLMSVNKHSSSVSPASSISDWSCESSSSASMAKNVCNSRTRIESSSSRQILSDTDVERTNSQNLQNDSSIEGLKIQHTMFGSSSARIAPGETVLPPAPVKPSGLRLPSPKIGFFDGVKSSVRTPRGGMQPHSVIPRGLPKHAARNPSDSQKKTKTGKLPVARSIVSAENREPTYQQNSLPAPLHESLDIEMKISSALQNVESSSETPKEVQLEPHLTIGSGAVDLKNDLHPLEGVHNKENVQCDYQIDCLSKQVGLMDINFQTQEKLTGDSLSSSQNDTSFQDKSNGLELSSRKELVDCPKREESLKSSATPCLSVSQTSFEL